MNLKRKRLKNKSIKVKKSSIGLFALIIIFIGILFLSYNYFLEKKNKVYNEMNLLLVDSEEPENIDEAKNSDQNADEADRTQSAEEESKFNYQFIGRLEIPKIGLNRGFLDMNSPYNIVSRNITIIETSHYPDYENSNLILAAHSGDCYVCFFNKLWKLNKEDLAYVYYNNIKYTYKIVNIYHVKKTGQVEIRRDVYKKTLTLITCTHKDDTKQTVYILELQNEENY